MDRAVRDGIFKDVLRGIVRRLCRPFYKGVIATSLLGTVQGSAPVLAKTITHTFTRVFFGASVIHPLAKRGFLVNRVVHGCIRGILRHSTGRAPFHCVRSRGGVGYLFPLASGDGVRLGKFVSHVSRMHSIIHVVSCGDKNKAARFASMRTLFSGTSASHSGTIVRIFVCT